MYLPCNPGYLCRGFQLLSKMGYQPGQGLGKGAVGAAIPIAVEIKSKRTGLGIDEAQKERQSQQLQMQQLRGAGHPQTKQDQCVDTCATLLLTAWVTSCQEHLCMSQLASVLGR